MVAGSVRVVFFARLTEEKKTATTFIAFAAKLMHGRSDIASTLDAAMRSVNEATVFVAKSEVEMNKARTAAASTVACLRTETNRATATLMIEMNNLAAETAEVRTKIHILSERFRRIHETARVVDEANEKLLIAERMLHDEKYGIRKK